MLLAYKDYKDYKDIDAGGDTVPGLRFSVKYIHEPSLKIIDPQMDTNYSQMSTK